MSKRVARLLATMRESPGSVRFAEAEAVATHFFGPPRRAGSHVVFRMPWPGDPRVNLQQNEGGRAKAYQVKQLLLAIDRLQALRKDEDDV